MDGPGERLDDPWFRENMGSIQASSNVVGSNAYSDLVKAAAMDNKKNDVLRMKWLPWWEGRLALIPPLTRLFHLSRPMSDRINHA